MPQQSLTESLREKIARLIDDNRRLRDQAVKLHRSEEKSKGEKLEMQQRIAELEHRVNVLELSQSIAGSDEQYKKQARARINRLMREVDRCIALLNR